MASAVGVVFDRTPGPPMPVFVDEAPTAANRLSWSNRTTKLAPSFFNHSM